MKKVPNFFNFNLWVALCLTITTSISAYAAPDYIADAEEFSCNLPAPTNLVVTGTTTSTVSLQWDAVSGASGYNVYLYDDNNNLIYSALNVTSASHTATGLPSGMEMPVEVYPVCVNGKQGATPATTTAKTDSIIVDLIATENTDEKSLLDPNNIYTTPAYFGIKYQDMAGNTKYERFEVTINANNGEMYVNHANSEPVGENYSGWYFGIPPSQGGTPPSNLPVNNGQLAGSSVYVYKVIDGEFVQQIIIFPTQASLGLGTTGVMISSPNSKYEIWEMEPPVGKGVSASAILPVAKPDFTVSPNPLSGSAHIASKTDFGKNARAEILDPAGRRVFELELPENGRESDLDLEFLSPGIYYLRLLSHEKTQTTKLIKS